MCRSPQARFFSATDGVPQHDYTIAMAAFLNQFQIQPHIVREEPLPAAIERGHYRRTKHYFEGYDVHGY